MDQKGRKNLTACGLNPAEGKRDPPTGGGSDEAVLFSRSKSDAGKDAGGKKL